MAHQMWYTNLAFTQAMHYYLLLALTTTQDAPNKLD